MNLYEDGEGEDAGRMAKIDGYARLRQLGDRPGRVPAWLCHGNRPIQGYVHTIPLPEKSRRSPPQSQPTRQIQGTHPQRGNPSLSGWALIFTSLPPEAPGTASALYRVRWQVGLVIKRLKSLLDADGLRAHKGSKLAELYLHGKLLYAAVLEKLAQSRFAAAKPKPANPRQITDWRLWKTMADGLKACFPVNTGFEDDCIRSLGERPRKRTLQGLPGPILTLLRQVRGMGLNRV